MDKIKLTVILNKYIIIIPYESESGESMSSAGANEAGGVKGRRSGLQVNVRNVVGKMHVQEHPTVPNI